MTSPTATIWETIGRPRGGSLQDVSQGRYGGPRARRRGPSRGEGQCVFLAGPRQRQDYALVDPRLHASATRAASKFSAATCPTLTERVYRLRRDQIGFVFQRFHLIRGLTACENVGVPLVLRGMQPRAVRQRAMTPPGSGRPDEKANVHWCNLSAGQCQRVALARALANDPN